MAPSDTDLLRQYTFHHSEAAFAELVRRHLDFVYAAAKRQLGSPSLAADVAQSVFLDLARHATSLRPDPSLVAWLHVVTRRTAVDFIRRESRRRTREQTASELSAMHSPSSWSHIAPLLDEALSRLNATDRTAVLLRFFENKSLREVGDTLGLTDDAAQKRITRALEKLRSFLARRGIAVTAAGLVTDLSAHVLESAPASLGATISAFAATPAAAALALPPATALVMTAAQKVLVSLVVAAALGGTLFEARIIRRQNSEIDSLQHRSDQLQHELDTLHRERAAQAAFLADLQRQLDVERAKSAKFAAADPAVEAALDDWLQNVVRLKEHLAQTPSSQIPELQFLTAKDWLDATKETKLDSDLDVRRALSELRRIAKGSFQPKLGEAIRRYLAANHGQSPADPVQLAPYFDSPIDPAVLARYATVSDDQLEYHPRIIQTNGQLATWRIRERQTVDDYYDHTMFVTGDGGYGSEGMSRFDREVSAAVTAFRAANNGQRPTDPAQLDPYLRSKIDPAFVRRKLDQKN